MPETPAPEYLVVGRVEKAHGLKGEMSVSIATDFPERFSPGSDILWRRGTEERMLRIATARPHGARLLLTFVDASDPEAARALSGGDLCIRTSEASTAPAGYFYDHEVRGWACEDPRGNRLGVAAGLEKTPAGPMLTLERPDGGEALVPFVEGIVVRVDREARRIVLDPPEGLLDLADS